MFCYKCGKKIKDDANFCVHCGEEVLPHTHKNVVDYEEKTDNQQEQEAAKKNIIMRETKNRFNGKSKKPFVVALISIGIVALLFIAFNAMGKLIHPDHITIKGERYSTSLTKLDLSDMGLNNKDIAPLRHMKNLTYLNLDNNQITDWTPLFDYLNEVVRKGTIQASVGFSTPVDRTAALTPLSGLVNLTTLSLTGNQISDLTPLSKLVNLTSLSLSNNSITDIYAKPDFTNWGENEDEVRTTFSLGCSSILRTLDDMGVQIVGISPLSNLANLTELHLKDNLISDFSPLFGLANLNTLSLEGNLIDAERIEELRATLSNCNMDFDDGIVQYESKDTSTPLNAENEPYSYEEAHDRFNEEKNPQDADNPKHPLQDDPIWELASQNNKIVQVDFMISIMYASDDSHIRLDVSLSMTNDELKEAEKHKHRYIAKVLEFLEEKGIDVNNYEMNYIIPPL